MGNRAVITTKNKDLGIYVHWNGGRDSVEAFLEYCKRKGFRPPEQDSYGWARLAQVIANFFGPGGLSVGIDHYRNLDTDNGDNGVYVIANWEIVGRIHPPELEQHSYSLDDMLAAIEAAQPSKEHAEDLLELISSCTELLNCIDPARDWNEAKRARAILAKFKGGKR